MDGMEQFKHCLKIIEESMVGGEQGLDQSQIYRFARREDIRAFIEQEQLKLIEAIPDAVENVKGLVREIRTSRKGKRRGASYPTRQV